MEDKELVGIKSEEQYTISKTHFIHNCMNF